MASATDFSASPVHLLITLSLLLAAALIRRSGDAAGRWASASAALLGLVAVWLVAGPISAAQVLPSLQRLYGVLLAILAVWASCRPRRLLERAGAAGLGLAALLLLAGIAFPPSPPFSQSWLDLAWTLLTLGATAAGAFAVAAWRPHTRIALLAALGAMTLGVIGHSLTPPAFDPGSSWLGIAQAVATPLIAIAGIGSLLAETSASRISAPESGGPRPLRLETLADLLAGGGSGHSAAALCEAVAEVTRARLCLVLTPPDRNGHLGLAGYDRAAGRPVSATTLAASSAPAVGRAVSRGTPLVLPADKPSPDVVSVLHLVGRKAPAGAVLVPLARPDGAPGGLMIIAAPGSPALTDATRQGLERLASAWGRRAGDASGATDSAEARSVPSQDLEAARSRIADLESRLETAAPSDWVGIEDLRRQLDESQQAIQTLEAETDRLRSSSVRETPLPLDQAERLHADLRFALQALAEARQAAEAEARRDSTSGPAPAGMANSLQAARQPLTAIAGYTELLLGESVGLLGSAQRQFLRRIRAAVKRLDAELGTLSQLVGRQAAAGEPSRVDLGLALERGLEGVQSRVLEKNLGLRLDLPPAPTVIAGDNALVDDLIRGLLTLAADQAPPGREIVVSLLAHIGEEVAVITASDHGPPGEGEPFADLPGEGVTRAGAGEPPGLARLRLLAGRLAGRLWFRRAPEGTRISVLLPTAP